MSYSLHCCRLYNSESAAACGYDIAAIYAFGKGTAVNFADSLLKEFPERLIDVSIEPASGVIGFAPRKGVEANPHLSAVAPLENDKKRGKAKTSKYRGVVYNTEFNAWQISTTALGY